MAVLSATDQEKINEIYYGLSDALETLREVIPCDEPSREARQQAIIELVKVKTGLNALGILPVPQTGS